MNKLSTILLLALISSFAVVSKAVGAEQRNLIPAANQPSGWSKAALAAEPLPIANSDEPAQTVDKSQYNLFNPTPRKYWRDFNPDRPGKTETPLTIDAGNFSVEADLFTYTKNNRAPDGTVTENYQLFVPNLKIGLTNNLDFQVISEFYNIQQTKNPDGSSSRNSGFGDVKLRMKYNFWGNDGGKTAFAILPFVKIPTNKHNLGNSSIEGGVLLPLAIKLDDRWNVGINTGIALNRNNDDTGYDASFVNSVSFDYGITKSWSTYLELATETGPQFVASLDSGLTYLLTEDIQLDASVDLGLTQGTDNFQSFVGVAVRF